MVPKFIFENGVVRNEFGYWLDLNEIKSSYPWLNEPLFLLHCVYEDFQRKSHPECIISGGDQVLGTRFNVYGLPKEFANSLTMEGQELLPKLQEYFGEQTVENVSKKVGQKKVGGK